MAYVENRDTREILIRYFGEEAYHRFDDSAFKLQYRVLWNVPVYREIASLLYGMNWKQIDWVAAQEMVSNANQDDAIVVGFKSFLLHPEVFVSSRLQKDNNESQREWERVESLGLATLLDVGNAWAQWLKGFRSDIVEQDFDSAKRWYNLAAEQGFALAQNSLGVLYEDDRELQFDVAEYYYEQASLQGHALAQYNLAMLHDETDFDIMKQHLEQAAAQGHASSLYFLGRLYLDSDLVQQNYKTAVVCFGQSAKHGHAEACAALVNLYLELKLGPQDNEVKKKPWRTF
jgi:hypothetical protein